MRRGIPCYGRGEWLFAVEKQVDCAVFAGPDGVEVERPSFCYQPAKFAYDDRGYEWLEADGEAVIAVRFTPDRPGTWSYRALRAGEVVESGEFVCEPSDHPGYVEVSEEDSRYFCHSDGSPYTCIGLNLVRPPSYALSRGGEFERSERTGTLGYRDYARWFRHLRENGGNYARLWLSADYFQVEGEVAGRHDLLRFATLDRVIELARECGIRLKLCLEHFRTFEPGSFTSRVYAHPEDGSRPEEMDDWFRNDRWQALWMHKVRALTARHGDDPAVFAWELWNEIDCCKTGDFAVQREWTRRMLRVLKELSPRNLAVNSLGSFDHERKQALQDDFKMPEMEFQQVHRYLDQGASLAICSDPVAGSIDAVQRARRPDLPVILTETGAVNDSHTGPFRHYRADHRGIIFHDTTYPAFFAGAAGSGHIWHWDVYVDSKNLWPGFRALAELLEGVALDRKGFEPVELSTDAFWCLGLRGRTRFLLWVRNRRDTWQRTLRDGIDPEAICSAEVDLAPFSLEGAVARTFSPWPEAVGEVRLEEGVLHLPDFRYGLLVRLEW